MSEPKRYERCYHKDYIPEGMEEHYNGKWVSYADYARLKAEVERLESDLKMEKENEDRLVRLWQTANNEVHGQATQIAALIDNQTRLNSLIANSEQENARLRKAGDDLAEAVGDPTIDWPPREAAWNAAKEGKQS